MYKIKLSPYAKIFYTEWLLDPTSFRYNVVYVQILHGKLDVLRLSAALKKYVNDHLLLNSHIQEIDGEPHWVKNASINELEYVDQPISESELLAYVTNKFDLYSGTLYRFKLLRVTENVYKFVIVLHHLVMDGSSLDVGVFATISDYYNDKNYRIKYNLDEQIKLVAELADNLEHNLTQHKDKHIKFWHQQLSGIENVELKFLKLERSDNISDAEEPRNPITELRFSYGDDVIAKLNQIKLKYSATPFMYGQCIFAMLLHRYTGQKQLAIAYPIAIKEGIEFIYGAQLNINLAPYRFEHDATVLDLFRQAQEFFRSIKLHDTKYSYYPITELFNVRNDEFSKDLLNISFIQAPFRDNLFAFDGINKVEASSELNVDSVPKNMLLFEQEIKLRHERQNYRIRYDNRSFAKELISDFVNNYQRLFFEVLEDLLGNVDGKQIINYSLLDAQQYRKIVHEFNQTDKPYPSDKTIHQIFEEQVVKTPHNIAVVYENKKLTYQELNNKANQLANYLLKTYVIKPDDLIALLLGRSEYMIIAILAVLKTGAAYVPISPDYPETRIKYMLEDTRCQIAINDSNFKKRFFLS